MRTSPLFLSSSILPIYFYDLFRVNFKVEFSTDLFYLFKDYEFVKNLKTVTPAEAGVQNSLKLLDSRFRGNDKNGEVTTFYETIKDDNCEFCYLIKELGIGNC